MTGRFLPNIGKEQKNHELKSPENKFKVNVDWGSLPKVRDANSAKQKTKNMLGQPSFLTGNPATSVHHEPTLSELGVDKNSVKALPAAIPTDRAVHILFHKRRYELLGNPDDLGGVKGQISLMTDDESDQLEQLENDSNVIEKIDKEILTRRQRFKIRRW